MNSGERTGWVFFGKVVQKGILALKCVCMRENERVRERDENSNVSVTARALRSL